MEKGKRFVHIVKEKMIQELEVEKTEIRQNTSEFVVATNMISVGIDVSRFNTIIMNSMPENSRVHSGECRAARDSTVWYWWFIIL